ncbi:hypothetical protein AXF42_Ash010979 [Apostasia shenzhenica]|uniref:Uncharacterized protein n=1 Tax=Apostasia shenzhenica TaxID=1088818 RepID=A0A2H9ZQS8_9ASPA|nr:hypothetical protein AXF42_Ash010979 [Apostasia shenzhenica]
MPPVALSQLNPTFSIDEITASTLPVSAIPDETEVSYNILHFMFSLSSDIPSHYQFQNWKGLEEPPTMMPPNESTSSSFQEILDQLRSDPSFADSFEQEIYNEQMLNSLLISWQSGDDHEPKLAVHSKIQPAETKSNNVIGSDGSDYFLQYQEKRTTPVSTNVQDMTFEPFDELQLPLPSPLDPSPSTFFELMDKLPSTPSVTGFEHLAGESLPISIDDLNSYLN